MRPEIPRKPTLTYRRTTVEEKLDSLLREVKAI
jgi:hypothetical protein